MGGSVDHENNIMYITNNNILWETETPQQNIIC